MSYWFLAKQTIISQKFLSTAPDPSNLALSPTKLLFPGLWVREAVTWPLCDLGQVPVCSGSFPPL